MIDKTPNYAVRLRNRIKIPVFDLTSIQLVGFYKGKTIKYLIDDDPRELQWFIDNKVFTLSKEADKYYKRELEKYLSSMIWLEGEESDNIKHIDFIFDREDT